MSTRSYGINPNRLTFASGTASFNNRTFVGLQGMTPKEEIKKEPVYGSGQKPVGMTRGQLSGTFSFEILLSEGDALLQDLGPGFSDVPFDVSGTYMEPGGVDATYTLGVVQCTIKNIETSYANDGKALTYKFDCALTEPISWNGVKSIDLPEDADVSLLGLVVSLF
jgi:hypothetical protein